jgi:predicted TIM-barrel fold metal-dependent hydrolase
MKINFGLISADSHAQLHRDAFAQRMSKAKFGNRIPHVEESSDPSWRAFTWDERPVERWVVDGRVVDTRGVANCPALMGNIDRMFMPQRWEDTPPAAYDPIARLKVLDEDGVDGEVLFCNNPAFGSCFIQCDAELELACVQAYNDAIWEWREASDRYVPLMIIPYFSGIEATVREVTRCARKGFRGLIMLAEPSSVGDDKFFKKDAPVNSAFRHCLKHFCDPYWEPLWAACQDLGIAIHWHADGGLKTPLSVWKRFTAYELFAVTSPAAHSSLAQFLPNVVFTGVLERYPGLNWVCAETTLGWFNYVLDSCDQVWERRQLWKHGIKTRPSEQIRERVYADFWFEKGGEGLDVRYRLRTDHIMWQSDLPHGTSTYPESRKILSRALEGVPEKEVPLLLYKNAMKLYGLDDG